jgi:hypothetical protein
MLSYILALSCSADSSCCLRANFLLAFLLRAEAGVAGALIAACVISFLGVLSAGFSALEVVYLSGSGNLGVSII